MTNIETLPLSGGDSYLPIWVLQMRTKIQKSRETSDSIQSRIDNIANSTKELGVNITKLKNNSKTDNKFINNLTKLNPLNLNSLNNSINNPFILLPGEVLCIIFDLLSIKQVCLFESTAKIMKSLILNSQFWFIKSQNDINNLNNNFNNNQIYSNDMIYLRLKLIKHAKQTKECLQFIKLMKQQRSILKYNNIENHRYFSNETTITHPYPIYDTTNQNNSHKIDSIMSKSEILNYDFRFIANKCLEILYELTNNIYDTINLILAKEGSVSVFISLLSNESANIQNLSCGIIANLLVWESKFSLFSLNYSLIKPFKTSISYKLISEQITNSNGNKLLLQLLTSPTASVNIATVIHSIDNNYMKKASPKNENRMTSSIQGVSNKEACRALINLFDPLKPIPANYNSSNNNINNSNNKNDILNDTKQANINSIKLDNSIDCMNDAIQSIEAINSIKPSSTNNSTTTTATTPMISISSIFLNSVAYPWIFRYYYKSGTLKDRFTTYIRFVSKDMFHGRGIDSLGPFYLYGKTNLDMIGYSWYIYKTYINSNIIENNSNSNNSNEINLNEWMYAIDDNSNDISNQNESMNPMRSHVSHIGYWSNGLEDNTFNIHNNNNNNNNNNKNDSIDSNSDIITENLSPNKRMNQFIEWNEDSDELATPGAW